MTTTTNQNLFAPPRAHVEDQLGAPSELVAATRGSRFLAYLVDISPGFAIGIVGAVMFFSMLSGLFSGHFDPKSANLASLGLFGLVIFVGAMAWLIWTIVLLYKYGQTVGKRALGIRVVRMDGSRVSFARFFFLRGLALVIIVWIVGAIGALMHAQYVGNLVTLVDCLAIFGAARRCLHDYIADTQVVTAESSPHATLEGSLSR